ncbi:MAG: hypothetical protein DRJ64_07310 [Thermoprotei archaeon]|nr:MAG: hypothetical protein DRJ64_07310 [Thermoprotei archaeon]
MEIIVNFRIKDTLTPLKGFYLLDFWGDYESLSNAVLDELGIGFLDNPLNFSMSELNSRGDIEITITDDNLYFDHETLEKFMDLSRNIDKSLAEVFMYWCSETDNDIFNTTTFVECYEGVYSGVDEFAEEKLYTMIKTGSINVPDIVLQCVDFIKFWNILSDNYISYIDKNDDVHIIRKTLKSS